MSLSLPSPPPQDIIPATTIPITTVPTPILGYGKELANTAKLYTDDQKYSNISGNFNFKLTIFYNICNRANILFNTYFKALSFMLIGLALNHYYNNKLAILIFNKAYHQFYSFFKGLKLERQTLSK